MAVATATAFGLLVLAAPAALAQPANDDFASATVITTLPFGASENTSDATFDPTDPFGCTSNGSVWFAYTPTSNGTIVADTVGSNYDTVLSAWTGTQGALTLHACNDDASGVQSRITLPVTGGTTVYFMVGICCGSGFDGGGPLTFSVDVLVPAANDNFADAIPITTVPFADGRDLSAATTEPSEPQPCFGARNTVWYSFTPATTQSINLRTDQFGGLVGVYTGTSLSDLTQIACSDPSRPALLPAQAGTTYYLQVAAWCCDAFGPVTFRLVAAPNPVASFFFFPSQPSVFDVMQFHDFSNDPAGGVISSSTWDFGDGATATGCCPTHQYAQDGDYSVLLTVTTADGRTASISQVAQVRTHDVAIVQLSVPNTAHVGQTIGIDVLVRNTRYPETVTVELLKSTPSGFAQVGALTQLVPVRPPGGNSTRFEFSYTVSGADLTIGKISFRATAILQGRDALPGDNQLTSPPVKVN